MHRPNKLLAYLLILSSSALCFAGEESDPAEIVIGERLFLETRFAQLFQQHIVNGGAINSPLAYGDPALDGVIKFQGVAPDQTTLSDGPFIGQSFSCRSCHMVDELIDDSEFGMRTYADFARRSPLQAREDGRTLSVRNSPALVNTSIPRANFLLHFDGEFSSMNELVRETLTGRMFGWLPGERKQAKQHICNVIKKDDGSNDLANEFGGLSYIEVLSGISSNGRKLNAEFLLPKKFRVNVKHANCTEIFRAASKLIAAYTSDLLFSQDDDGFNLSPYDQFLITNKLPRTPDDSETDFDYSQRLLQIVEQLEKAENLQFVDSNPNTQDGTFEFHDQEFQFNQMHLEGLKTFFNTGSSDQVSKGNCIACHAAPNFTDFSVHNTGTTQIEYDAIHGFGSFANLNIPGDIHRHIEADIYLPATNKHPNRQGIFRDIPNINKPSATDLGAWNVLFNFDFPKTQERLLSQLCTETKKCNSFNHALDLSIATFKTPGLRDINHSSPYMHNGAFNTINEIVLFYVEVSGLANADAIRNADIELVNMKIDPKDVEPLTAFLKSLNEDYN